MKDKTIKIVENSFEKDFESFKKNLFSLISEKIQEILESRKNSVSFSLLGEEGDAAAAEAEKQALFVDPNMAKEFFIKDLEYKENTITLKTLGTGIGKPVVSYINGEQFEVFADKEVAEKESKQAIDRMIEKGIDNLKDLRKSSAQLKKKKEAEQVKSQEEPKSEPEPEEKEKESK